MLFSSLVFLWYFLPITFLLYYCTRNQKWRNGLLLAVSLLFYAWGEPSYMFLMMISIVLNYMFGLWVDRQRRLWVIALCIMVNLLILGYFKYFNFFGACVNRMIRHQVVEVRNVVLPIGISFYTFQALSYVIDVYRGGIRVQKNLWKLALYISFFPQLIAGPIVKYHDIEMQLDERRESLDKVAYGIKRFCYGLGKKVIFANTFAAVVDLVLSPRNQEYMSGGLAWFVLLLYTMQIYYDFSGYSDMAIGLGKLFGFDFMENFNYPYISGSVREFWRRWHISLSTWFREYVYIPLGGNRGGNMRTYANLFLVFLLTGLWHGAGNNFVMWGVYHGIFIVAERVFLGKWLEKNPAPLLNHVYTMAVVFVGWLMFRVESLGEMTRILKMMVGGVDGPYGIAMFADARTWVMLGLALLLCGPLQVLCPGLKTRLYEEQRIDWFDMVSAVGILGVCTVLLVCNTYNPFIYFRF